MSERERETCHLSVPHGLYLDHDLPGAGDGCSVLRSWLLVFCLLRRLQQRTLLLALLPP